MIQLVARDADDFHVAFLGLYAFGRPHSDDRAVFVFHAMTHLAIREEVHEVVLVNRERLEARDLGTRECHVVRHESVRVRREAVVDP